MKRTPTDRIMAIVKEAYEEGTDGLPFPERPDAVNTGDGLATFIANEIDEVTVGVSEYEEALSEAVRAMERAQEDIFRVIIRLRAEARE